MIACRRGFVIAVPLFEPLVEVHPPCVWIPIASPVASLITGEPELPPVVSTA